VQRRERLAVGFRSMDVAGASILAGHVAASMARNLAATVLVFGVAFLIGFWPSAGPLEWLAAGGVLLGFMLAISWLSAAIGLLARSPEAAGGFTFFMAFVPYPSSAFVPIDTMPTWLHGVANNQPVTPGHRDPPQAAARHPGRLQPLAGAGVVRRHPGRLGGAVRRAVPAPHGLTSPTRRPPVNLGRGAAAPTAAPV
jgi:ABC-2 type transporter